MRNKIYLGVLAVLVLVILGVFLKILLGGGDAQPKEDLSSALPVTEAGKQILQEALGFDTSISMYLAGAMQVHSLEGILFAPSPDSTTARKNTLEQILSVYQTGFAYVGEVGILSYEPLVVRKVFVLSEGGTEVVYHLYTFNNCLAEEVACKLVDAQVGAANLNTPLPPVSANDYLTTEQELGPGELFYPIGDTDE